jgi:hypothetical protein
MNIRIARHNSYDLVKVVKVYPGLQRLCGWMQLRIDSSGNDQDTTYDSGGMVEEWWSTMRITMHQENDMCSCMY